MLDSTWAMAESSYAVAVKRGPTMHHPSKKDREDGVENKFAELLVALIARFAFHPMINSWTQFMK